MGAGVGGWLVGTPPGGSIIGAPEVGDWAFGAPPGAGAAITVD